MGPGRLVPPGDRLHLRAIRAADSDPRSRHGRPADARRHDRLEASAHRVMEVWHFREARNPGRARPGLFFAPSGAESRAALAQRITVSICFFSAADAPSTGISLIMLSMIASVVTW